MRIGIDFDNTLAGYDHVIAAAAQDAGLALDGAICTKTKIRDAIRRQENGDEIWQRLQGQVYGARMGEARLLAGADEFLTACRDANIETFIVSHKTKHNRFDPARIDLRQAARAWMRETGFFDAGGFAIPETNVYFEATRGEKLARIAALGCTDFIDDLEEVFLEDCFPAGVSCYLLAPGRGQTPDDPFKVFHSWREISHGILGTAG